jgi:hypothetical protein
VSKFDYESFYGGYDDFAVNKEKYNKEQAVDLYKEIKDIHKGKGMLIAICEAFVRHRAGGNEDGEHCVGWWLEYKQHERSCPVWAFHIEKPNTGIFKDYEYFEFE